MFGIAVIAAILTLNVSVVLDGSSDSVLKWELVGKILAFGDSGSGNEECAEYEWRREVTRPWSDESKIDGVYCSYNGWTTDYYCMGSGSYSCVAEGCTSYSYVCDNGDSGYEDGCDDDDSGY